MIIETCKAFPDFVPSCLDFDATGPNRDSSTTGWNVRRYISYKKYWKVRKDKLKIYKHININKFMLMLGVV